MGLTRCNDCGNTVSTSATVCPHCGAPVANGSAVMQPHQAPGQQVAQQRQSPDFVTFFKKEKC